MTKQDLVGTLSDVELQAELERRKKLRLVTPVPIPPDFDRLQKYIVASINGINTEDPREPKDFEHYVWETAMEAVYGKEFWKWWKRVFK